MILKIFVLFFYFLPFGFADDDTLIDPKLNQKCEELKRACEAAICAQNHSGAGEVLKIIYKKFYPELKDEFQKIEAQIKKLKESITKHDANAPISVALTTDEQKKLEVLEDALKLINYDSTERIPAFLTLFPNDGELFLELKSKFEALQKKAKELREKSQEHLKERNKLVIDDTQLFEYKMKLKSILEELQIVSDWFRSKSELFSNQGKPQEFIFETQIFGEGFLRTPTFKKLFANAGFTASFDSNGKVDRQNFGQIYFVIDKVPYVLHKVVLKPGIYDIEEKAIYLFGLAKPLEGSHRFLSRDRKDLKIGYLGKDKSLYSYLIVIESDLPVLLKSLKPKDDPWKYAVFTFEQLVELFEQNRDLFRMVYLPNGVQP